MSHDITNAPRACLFVDHLDPQIDWCSGNYLRIRRRPGPCDLEPHSLHHQQHYGVHGNLLIERNLALPAHSISLCGNCVICFSDGFVAVRRDADGLFVERGHRTHTNSKFAGALGVKRHFTGPNAPAVWTGNQSLARRLCP